MAGRSRGRGKRLLPNTTVLVLRTHSDYGCGPVLTPNFRGPTVNTWVIAASAAAGSQLDLTTGNLTE